MDAGSTGVVAAGGQGTCCAMYPCGWPWRTECAAYGQLVDSAGGASLMARMDDQPLTIGRIGSPPLSQVAPSARHGNWTMIMHAWAGSWGPDPCDPSSSMRLHAVVMGSSVPHSCRPCGCRCSSGCLQSACGTSRSIPAPPAYHSAAQAWGGRQRCGEWRLKDVQLQSIILI